MDTDNSGNITSQELRDFLRVNAVKFNNEEIDKLIKEIDVNNDDDIDIAEFKSALVKQMDKMDI